MKKLSKQLYWTYVGSVHKGGKKWAGDLACVMSDGRCGYSTWGFCCYMLCLGNMVRSDII